MDQTPIIAYVLIKRLRETFVKTKADLIGATKTFGSISILLQPTQIELMGEEHQRLIGNAWDKNVKKINKLVVKGSLNEIKKKRKQKNPDIVAEKSKKVYKDPYDENGILTLEDDIPATLEDNNLDYKEDWETYFDKIKKGWADNLSVSKDTYATDIGDVILEFYTNPLFMVQCSEWYHQFFG